MSRIVGYIRLQQKLELFRTDIVRDCLAGGRVFGNDVCCVGGDCQCAEEENESGLVCLFTGTLLNLAEIRQECQSQADAAALCLKLYRKHGNDFPMHLNGPFALVILDRSKGQLLICRDQLGQCPFFYSILHGGYVIFSNDLSILRKFPGCSVQVDAKALSDYLSLGYVPAPRTIFNGVCKLPAAHWLCLRSCGGLPALHCYWHPKFSPKSNLSLKDAAAEAWSLLDKAVNRCLSAHSNTGVLISGGIDSNLIMALCTTADNPIDKSFTVGFADGSYDERLLAEHSAAALHVKNIQQEIMPDSWEELAALQRLNGEPYADSSLIPTTLAMRLAATHGIQCVLTGSGGDEFFGGYRRYQAMLLRAVFGLLPGFALRGAGRLLGAMVPGGTDARSRSATIRRFAKFLQQDAVHGYAGFQGIFSEEMKTQLIRDWNLKNQPSFSDDWRRIIDEGDADDFVEKFNELDILTYLPEDGCTKERLAASAVGIDGLCPIMDMEVVEFGLSLPRSLRVTLRERKRVLRQIGRSLLTPELLSQTKRGFGMPVSAWFRGPQADAARALSSELRQWDEHGWFDENAVKRLVDDHIAGTADHGSRLWALLCLRKWLGK